MIECAVGTYNPTTMAWDIAHCLACPPGHFCGIQALKALTMSAPYTSDGKCAAGFFCSINAISMQPQALDDAASRAYGTNNPPRWGPCPQGHYCPEESAYPTKCPIGKYNALTQKKVIGDCLDCDAGYFGETTGLIVNTCTGKCAPGYYCEAGATTPTPTGTAGDICPVAYYCAEGSY